MIKQYHVHSNSGFLPKYVWFHLGLAGTIASAGLVSFFARLISRNTFTLRKPSCGKGIAETSFQIVLLYMVVASSRWIMYGLSQITRGVLICFLVCLVLLRIDSATRKRNSRIPLAIRR